MRSSTLDSVLAFLLGFSQKLRQSWLGQLLPRGLSPAKGVWSTVAGVPFADERGLVNLCPGALRRRKGFGHPLPRCPSSAKGVWSTVDQGAFADKVDLVSRLQTILAAATQPGQPIWDQPRADIRVPDALSQDSPPENLHPATPSGISPGAESCPDNVADGSADCVVGRFLEVSAGYFARGCRSTLYLVTMFYFTAGKLRIPIPLEIAKNLFLARVRVATDLRAGILGATPRKVSDCWTPLQNRECPRMKNRKSQRYN
jgi:hypothetical protein